MAKTTFRIEDHSEEVLAALEKQIEAALIAVGAEAETAAKTNARNKGVLDTGRLMNSITFALDGEKANAREYTDNNGKRFDVQGIAPKEADKYRRSVIIGTNVEYGIYNELGTTRMKARPFLKPAITDNKTRYLQLIKAALGK